MFSFFKDLIEMGKIFQKLHDIFGFYVRNLNIMQEINVKSVTQIEKIHGSCYSLGAKHLFLTEPKFCARTRFFPLFFIAKAQ